MTRTTRGAVVGAAIGGVATLALIAGTGSVEFVSSFDTHISNFNPEEHLPPLHEWWKPRVGPGTVPAVLLAAAFVLLGPAAARSWRWSRLLPTAWLAGLLWIGCLALVDGVGGIAEPVEHRYEYLPTAREVDDVPALLTEFVDRIPRAAHPDNWTPHIAGHPPAALLAFVALVRLGVDTGLGVGLVLVALGATTPLAVVTTLRALDADDAARRALPFLVVAPAAIWVGVSADGGIFAPVTAWGIACLAVACRRRSHLWGAIAGVVLGLGVYLSYGFLLFGILAVAVLVAARTAYPLLSALVGASAVAGTFFAAGYSWFESFAALRVRYEAGLGGRRPYEYWVFGNVAAFAVCAGPVVGVALGHALAAPRRWLAAAGSDRVLALLGAAGWSMVLTADLSGMSKAEVERIWLPFVPWALLLVALLPRRWRRWCLVAQAAVALLVQHLLFGLW